MQGMIWEGWETRARSAAATVVGDDPFLIVLARRDGSSGVARGRQLTLCVSL